MSDGILTAVNPLPWILDSKRGYHLDEPGLHSAFAAVAGAGFKAVQTDIPSGTPVGDYSRLVTHYGLTCGPSYFAVEGTHSAAEAAERAQQLKALSVDLVFLAAGIAAPRFDSPGLGVDADSSRLAAIIEVVREVCIEFAGAGIRTALHPHVGTWIETEAETRRVLDEVDESLLGFGPDTGHLYWAGMDPLAFVSEFADRVCGLHVKDASASARDVARAEGLDYFSTTEQLHLWREPGLGDLPVDAILDIAATSPNCEWAVIEVDVPYIGSAEESTAYCADWARQSPQLWMAAPHAK